MKKIFCLIALLFSINMILFSQTPPPPNGGDYNNGGNTPVGGGAPIGSGLGIMLSLGLGYAWKSQQKNKLQ